MATGVLAHAASADDELDVPVSGVAASQISPIEDELFNSGDFLTGDWGGLRSQLIESGVTPFLFYDSITSANLGGGLRDDQGFVGQVYAGVDLDLEKLFGLNGTTMKISYVNRHGNTIADSVGGIYDPQTIFGGQTNFLYQFYLEKQFGENWWVKLGRVSADTDFANNELYRYSLSTAINGPVRATLLEGSITSFPFSVWGGRVKYIPNDEHQFQVGVYQTGPDQFDFTNNGLNFTFRSEDGVSVLAQYDWTPGGSGDTRVTAGVINSFRDFDNFDGGTTDFLFRAYLHAETKITDGLTAFGLVSYSPQDEVALTPLQLSMGLNYEGLFPGRDDDRTIFFATYGQLSDEFGDATGEDVDYELVLELGHRFQLGDAAYIQPSLQYINNPGGTGNVDDAFVLGAWVGLAF